MKKTLKLLLSALLVISAMSCQKESKTDVMSDKEKAFKSAVEAYIPNTVINTYKYMADASIDIYEGCQNIASKFKAGTLSSSDIQSTGDAWKVTRKYWEQSEAFLFGAAGDYNIDPHIDSWPLDRNAMENMLANEKQMEQMSPEYVANNLGYGLLGFHAVEYMLFELSEDGKTSHPRSVSKFTEEEVIYLEAVAGDLCLQCLRLEAAWAGMDNITSIKAEMLTDAELEPSMNYGDMMLLAGSAGSTYKTYQECAEEIIDGCITIADEVANTKLGMPVTAEDPNYIESPYSLNSIVDFCDNIVSIQNAYFGAKDGDASLSDYVKGVNPSLDSQIAAAADEAIKAIKAVGEPFAQTANTEEGRNAVNKVNVLVELLEMVPSELAK